MIYSIDVVFYMGLNALFIILGKTQEIQVQHCSSNLCFEEDVAYDIPTTQLQSLINSSTSCSQEITLKCLLAPTEVKKCIICELLFTWFHKKRNSNFQEFFNKTDFCYNKTYIIKEMMNSWNFGIGMWRAKYVLIKNVPRVWVKFDIKTNIMSRSMLPDMYTCRHIVWSGWPVYEVKYLL